MNRPEKPSAQTLRCGQCGAPFELRAGPRTRTIVCAYCDSATDLTDPTYRILWRYEQKLRYKPLIPLGARGQVRGETLVCIGYLRRSATIDGEAFEWTEHLLYNPYKGYRWLVRDDEQWTLARVLNQVPEAADGQPAPLPTNQPLTYDESTWEPRSRDSGLARVDYAVGEFPWAVSVGQEVVVRDYTCAGDILSAEITPTEVTWSHASGMSAAEVREAFGLPDRQAPFTRKMKAVTFRVAAVFLAWCVLGGLATWGFSIEKPPQTLFAEKYPFFTNVKERALVTREFTVPPPTGNLEVSLDSNVENRWLSVHVSLINGETGDAYDFGLESTEFHGWDNEGAWKEGEAHDSVVLSRVPAGQWYLFIEPESGTGDAPDPVPSAQTDKGPLLLSFDIAVKRNVTLWWPWLVMVVVLLIVAIFDWAKMQLHLREEMQAAESTDSL